ncbi:MAG: hypothetical protein AAF585_04465 [Verrucomicrobiota bacterium]
MSSLLTAILLTPLVAEGLGGIVGDVIDTVTAPIGNLIDAVFGDEEAAPEQKAQQMKVIGTVRFTYEGYALIYTPTGSSTPAGTIATTLDAEGNPSAVEMRISAERKNSFLVADILRGSPKAGQMVIVKPRLQPGASQYQVLE